MNGQPRPLLIWSSVLVTLQILAGGAALGNVVGANEAGLFVLGVAALQGGTQFYIQGQVTPTAKVVARLDGSGNVVAGPAAATPVEGSPVDVQPAPDRKPYEDPN